MYFIFRTLVEKGDSKIQLYYHFEWHLWCFYLSGFCDTSRSYKNINMQRKEDMQCYYLSTKPHYLFVEFLNNSIEIAQCTHWKLQSSCLLFMYIFAFKNVSSRRSRFIEEWVRFFRKALWENTLLKTQALYCLWASAVFSEWPQCCFFPSFAGVWGQTMNSVSVWAQLGSGYDAIVLTGDGCPAGRAVDPGLSWHCQSLLSAPPSQ